MFGMPKRTPMFAPPYATPGIGDGDPRQEQNWEVAGARGGIFGGKKKKRNVMPYVLAALEDTISRQMGYQPQGVARILGRQQETQQQAAQMADEQRKRSLGMEDWLAKETWKRDNPSPDAFERSLAGAGVDPNSEQGQQLYRQRAEAMARDPMDEFVVVPIPGRGTYAGLRSGLADVFAGQGAPANITEEMWNSGRPVGGGAGNGTGGF